MACGQEELESVNCFSLMWGTTKMFSIFSRKDKTRLVVAVVNPSGSYELAVVGESHYQRALAEICGAPTEEGHRLEAEAHLVPEDDNPYDSNAVKVTVSGKQVGYLDREAAL